MAGAEDFRQMCRRIPGGCSTAAKSPLRNPSRSGPYFANDTMGGYFTDDEGREWLDFDMALSSVVLGYAHQGVNDAAIRQITRGITSSLPCFLEAQLAERLFERFPVAECVRFCKDGSDSTSAAVRIARSITGRSKVVAATYHGWHDWSAVHYYANDPDGYRRLGIPQSTSLETIWLSDESFAQFEATVGSHDNVAGVIVCPENWAEVDLRLLSDYCIRKQSVLIFDEIKSGIRYGPGGVGGSIAVAPDLICLGKSIANGFPLAIVGGRSELMLFSTDVAFSTTAASEAASLAAAIAVDDHLRSSADWPPWQSTCQGIISRLSRRIEVTDARDRLTIRGYPGNFRIHTVGFSPRDDPFRKVFVETLARNGIYSSGYIAPCAVHNDTDFSRLETAAIEAIESWGHQ